MRLLYLDEAGTDSKAKWLSVAGILVNGDQQWPLIDKRIGALIDAYIPVTERRDFAFHTTDLFHGAAYFDRRKWPQERRFALLRDLAQILVDLQLPILWGRCPRAGFGADLFAATDTAEFRTSILHAYAVMDCLCWTDKLLERDTPDELAAVVHEDGARNNKLIKKTFRWMREPSGYDSVADSVRSGFGLPLKRIVDTVHFADRVDARPLQLADLCAFALNRIANDLSLDPFVAQAVLSSLCWTLPLP